MTKAWWDWLMDLVIDLDGNLNKLNATTIGTQWRVELSDHLKRANRILERRN